MTSNLPSPTSAHLQAMDSQKQFTGPEIQFLLSCSEADENEMINCEEFANRFQEPAREIGFNVAVLLTNLSEHVPHDPRLRNFLELAESILEYFRPYLGRIEIMGASRRIERIYFEISETNRAQWEMPQVREPKRVHAGFLGLPACSSHSWTPHGAVHTLHICSAGLGGPLLSLCKLMPTLFSHFLGPAVPLHVLGSPSPTSCSLGAHVDVHLLYMQHQCALTVAAHTPCPPLAHSPWEPL